MAARQLIAWPGYTIDGQWFGMTHLVDDNGALCGALLVSASGISRRCTFTFTGVICPICDRLQDLPPALSNREVTL